MNARSAWKVAGLVAALVTSGVLDAQPRETAGPSVYSADVDSIIHPVSAEYMIETMDRADHAGAVLVVFTLRTPGGLVDSTRDIITHMLAARTPVAIFIGPSGARAASAGFLLTIAAGVAALAAGPPLRRGAPPFREGGKKEETGAQKGARGVAAHSPPPPTPPHPNPQ